MREVGRHFAAVSLHSTSRKRVGLDGPHGQPQFAYPTRGHCPPSALLSDYHKGIWDGASGRERSVGRGDQGVDLRPVLGAREWEVARGESAAGGDGRRELDIYRKAPRGLIPLQT